MKMLALVIDGYGHLHIAASRSPDLLRRSIAMATGSAVLQYVSIPTGGARPVIEELDRQLAARRIAPGIYDIKPAKVVAKLLWREKSEWMVARFVRPLRRLRNRFAYHLAQVLR